MFLKLTRQSCTDFGNHFHHSKAFWSWVNHTPPMPALVASQAPICTVAPGTSSSMCVGQARSESRSSNVRSCLGTVPSIFTWPPQWCVRAACRRENWPSLPGTPATKLQSCPMRLCHVLRPMHFSCIFVALLRLGNQGSSCADAEQ
jgi:hypothetical protein